MASENERRESKNLNSKAKEGSGLQVEDLKNQQEEPKAEIEPVGEPLRSTTKDLDCQPEGEKKKRGNNKKPKKQPQHKSLQRMAAFAAGLVGLIITVTAISTCAKPSAAPAAG